MAYLTVKDESTGEVIEKKSKFIGQVFPVSDEENAKAIIQQIKKAHHQARHSCSAYRLCTQPETERYNDDGEPGGTAGMPMLEVLRGAGLQNTLVVVTRYFGGTKLGTGGLVRAYTQTAQAALEGANVIEIGRFFPMSVQVDYTFSGKLEHWINSEGILHKDTVYGEQVSYHIYCTIEGYEDLVEKIIEMTNGGCEIKKDHAVEGYIEKGQLILD